MNTNFSGKQLTQIMKMVDDFSAVNKIILGSIPGLSLTAFELELLSIKATAEIQIQNLKAPKHLDGCKAGEFPDTMCVCDTIKTYTTSMGDLKAKRSVKVENTK